MFRGFANVIDSCDAEFGRFAKARLSAWRRTTIRLQQHIWVALMSVLPTVIVAQVTPADAKTRNWIFSGSELSLELQGKAGDGTPKEEPARISSSARANAYIAGVADATSGVKWCAAGKVLPHELADRVYSYSRTLGPERLKDNASILVTEALAVEFPCRGPATVDSFKPGRADTEF